MLILSEASPIKKGFVNCQLATGELTGSSQTICYEVVGGAYKVRTTLALEPRHRGPVTVVLFSEEWVELANLGPAPVDESGMVWVHTAPGERSYIPDSDI